MIAPMLDAASAETPMPPMPMMPPLDDAMTRCYAPSDDDDDERVSDDIDAMRDERDAEMMTGDDDVDDERKS